MIFEVSEKVDQATDDSCITRPKKVRCRFCYKTGDNFVLGVEEVSKERKPRIAKKNAQLKGILYKERLLKRLHRDAFAYLAKPNSSAVESRNIPTHKIVALWA